DGAPCFLRRAVVSQLAGIPLGSRVGRQGHSLVLRTTPVLPRQPFLSAGLLAARLCLSCRGQADLAGTRRGVPGAVARRGYPRSAVLPDRQALGLRRLQGGSRQLVRPAASPGRDRYSALGRSAMTFDAASLRAQQLGLRATVDRRSGFCLLLSAAGGLVS